MAGGAVRRVSAQELKRRMDAGEVLVFDVRKKEVYDRGHVKGAQALPIYSATWTQEVPRNRGIVLYWTWPGEGSAAGAAATLIGQGFRDVAVLQGGLDAWRHAGYPTEP